MLTLKLLRENPEFVIAKLAKKNFDAKEIIEKINQLDQNRRALQLEKDTCLAEQKKKAAQIGGLMKEGKREEAETVKAEVAALKARSSEIESKDRRITRSLTLSLSSFQISHVTWFLKERLLRTMLSLRLEMKYRSLERMLFLTGNLQKSTTSSTSTSASSLQEPVSLYIRVRVQGFREP